MCQQLTILAQQDEDHYIAQCEHGTIHLRWEHITVHLQVMDFRALLRVVLQAWEDKPTYSGKMRLGTSSITLEFPPDAHYPLIRLMRKAAARLDDADGGRLERCSRLFPGSTVHYLN
jgi:hypothetical protein